MIANVNNFFFFLYINCILLPALDTSMLRVSAKTVAWTAVRCSWLTRTDPADVARVESRTVISTTRREDTIPTPKEGVKGLLGNWMSPEEIETQFNDRYPGCMKGTTGRPR